MTIELAKTVNLSSYFRVGKMSQPCSVKSGKMFDEKLDETLNSLKTKEKSIPHSVEEVKLLQLKMLQGIFSMEESDDGDDFFSGLESMVNVQRLSLHQSQVIDKYAHQQKYSLRKGTDTSHHEINRLIDRVAEKVSLAPELIRSVVSAESNYNSSAVSPVGAQGLMQLMPATADDLGVENRFDPEQNLLGGSKYLKQLLDKYDGDLDHALAAYNWGQGNVDRHGIENIPNETRHYVAKVKKLLAAKPS